MSVRIRVAIVIGGNLNTGLLYKWVPCILENYRMLQRNVNTTTAIL